jgi:diguanylate cyclase (GGDEF)-like protein
MDAGPGLTADMVIDWISERFGVRERVVTALLLAGLVFYLDLVTSATFLAVALYIPIVGLFYGINSPSVFLGYAVICTILNAVSSIDDVSDIDLANAVTNRGMAALVLYSLCFLVYRNSLSADVLRRLATTDPLTGAFNRRHFMELMTREQRRADRYGTIYSVLMIDIDHFKRVNDTYGHQVGDLAIQAMANACHKMMRPTDIVARYGGEEFIVTLTHTDLQGAIKVAERLRQSVSEIVLQTEQAPLSFTISIGVSTYVKPSKLDQIIGAADQALYAAKEGGRNRVCSGAEPAVVPA